MKWSCMCVWEWIWAVSAIACGWTVMNSANFAQASSSRLGESTRVLPATRTRLGGPFPFWATHGLAQARRPRLSEISWSLHCRASRLGENSLFSVRTASRLSENAWRPLYLISLGRESAASGRSASRLSECASGCYVSLAVKWFIACIVLIIPLKYDMSEYAWVFGFYERNWHAWYGIHHGLWFRDALTWKLDEWPKRGGNCMRNMIVMMR